MKPIRSFRVRPALPERLAALEELAYNIRWSWDHETIGLFRRLDRDLWESSGHNPVLMLSTVRQERLAEAARDPALLAHLDRVKERLQEYTSSLSTWYRRSFGFDQEIVAAYFSMEFGLTECLPIYSGGLGILAGDHLKSASDLGVPLIGVGLLYQKGYFRQYLNPEGWQQERYPINDFHTLPVRMLRNPQGESVRVRVELAGREAALQLWSVQVGRVRLILLDANIPENPPEIRDVTDELYGGDSENRIRQEIVLGVGGVRALRELGIRPQVFHMNEGHCAFLVLERIRELMALEKLSFAEAREVVSASTIFTTHTPVPAGIDIFTGEQIERYFGPWRKEVGLGAEDLARLGRLRAGDGSAPFNMAALALGMTCFVNGVSRLHGAVARRMWKAMWPTLPPDEVPISHITNGVHSGSWISDDMRYLYDRYLGPGWVEEPSDAGVWRRGEEIPGEELWRTHERRRERLVAFARRRLADQLRRRGAGKAAIADARNVLDPEALTIGFARRFATYKRATLLLRDPARLTAILNDPERPVQVIYAGKAHPRDDEGKSLIREVVHLARRPELRRRIVFLEDYDAVVSRYLVGGVDVWLNTPRRPLEASGTSGMKASFNGALNLSILDGWWEEAWSTRTGWAIGRGEEYVDLDYQDRVESSALYDLLEREVVPLYYTRSPDGLPGEWIDLMKSAMSEICPRFNTNRMLQEYVADGYHPAMERSRDLEADGYRRARGLAEWRGRIDGGWSGVQITRVETDLDEEVLAGSEIEVRAWVRTGTLRPEDLAVEVYLGRLDEHEEIVEGNGVPMRHDVEAKGPDALFRAQVPCSGSGRQGLTVRISPHHEDLPGKHCVDRVVWAG